LTPEQHNKYLAYSNLAYGGLFVLLALLMMVFILGILGAAPNGPPVGLMIFFSLFALLIYGGMVIPSFVPAYGLLNRKK